MKTLTGSLSSRTILDVTIADFVTAEDIKHLNRAM